MKTSGFATIPVLLVVVLVGGVGVGWYLSNTGVIPKFSAPATSEQPPALPEIPGEDASREPNGSAETANWKTYKNDALNMSFKYPEGTIIQKRDSSDNSPNAIQASYEDPKAIGGGGPRPGWFMIIDMFKNPNKLTMQEWAKENNYTKGGYKGESPAPTVTPITISGKSGIKWVDSIKRYYNLIENGDEIIMIFTNVTSVAGKPEFNEAQYKSTIDHILSTLKFLP